ncbi:MAG: DIP1984 family protein [Oscillospiraceae bacterium]|jgi:hypothetical protein|nr:DIP1984 family protein [Oscillospiraceae bacterium]
MKLAEALLQRSEYQNKIENLQSRILANLKVQEGEKPHENPQELLKEAFAINEQLDVLVKKINRRNNQVTLSDGRIITEALADREMIMKKRNLLAAIASEASEKDYRLTHAEVKMYVTLPIGELQKQIDELSADFRALDAQIQALNWLTELE